MLKDLEKKIRVMWVSLDALKETRDVSSVVPQHSITPQYYEFMIDYGKAVSSDKLDYIAAGLVNNIACIKDHLKNWCAKNGKVFEGDNLIDNNLEVGLIHDLCNIGKHAELNRPPRSGHLPKIENLSSSLRISTGTKANSFAVFSMSGRLPKNEALTPFFHMKSETDTNSFATVSIDPKTGQPALSQGGGGSVGIQISGDVVDDHGVRLGDFEEICEKAIAAWEQALLIAGVPIPSP